MKCFYFCVCLCLSFKGFTDDILKQIQTIVQEARTAEKIRMRVSTENAANGESAGYIPKEVVLKSHYNRKLNSHSPKVQRITRLPNRVKRVYEPHHPKSDAKGYVTYPDVQPLIELMNVQSADHNTRRLMAIEDLAKNLRFKSINAIER